MSDGPDIERDAAITFIDVADLERSLVFDGRRLGLEVAMEQPRVRILRLRPGAYIGLCERDGEVVTEGMIVGLVRDDEDGMYERLRAEGVEFDGPPEDHPVHPIRTVFGRDPDGRRVEIQRFR